MELDTTKAPHSADRQKLTKLKCVATPIGRTVPKVTTTAQIPDALHPDTSGHGGVNQLSSRSDQPQKAQSTNRPAKLASLLRSTNDQTLVALLILLALLCYGNTLFHSFVYDDEQQILQNPYVKSFHFLPQIFTTTVWSFVGAAGTTNYYRPLMTFTFLILWQLFGDIPFGFHLFNITLNAAVVVMVFYAGRGLFRDRRIAWLAAALFAVHPIHTEVVDWIAAVPELEVTFFVLLTFWLFTRIDQATWRTYAALVVSFALALLSKEPALMFAPLAIAYEFFVRPSTILGNNSSRSASATSGESPSDSSPAPVAYTLTAKITRCFPICAVAAGYLLLRIFLFGKLAPVLQHPKITWPQAIYSGFALVAGYTKYLFWPAPLSAFHVFHASTSAAEWPVLIGMAILLIAAALILYLCQRAPAAAVCILWMGITIAPMLNARWMAANVFTERYLYLPSVGFCWLAAWCAIKIWDATTTHAPETLRVPQVRSWFTNLGPLPHSPRIRMILLAAGALIFLASLAAILQRNAIWRSDLTLYTRTLETNPDAAVIRSNLGALYFDAEQFDRALQEWQIALAQKPDNVVTMNALGVVDTRLNRYADAEAIFKQAMAAKPLWGDSHFNYALLLQKTGHLPEALQEFKTGVTLSPLSGPAHRWYGEALIQNSQLDEAAVQFQQAVELEASLDSMQDLVNVYHQQGRDLLSAPILRRMVKQFPYDSTAHLALAKTLEATHQPTEALHEYQQVLATDSTNPEAQAAVHRLQSASTLR
jgi:tetratricopeptide (TPR) repeat protein